MVPPVTQYDSCSEEAATVLGLIAGWIEDYNDNHRHAGLKMRSPREFIAAQTATT
jgi:transposase InsO family protein